MSRKQIIDSILTKYLSRKLFIVVISTIALFINVLDGENWTIIALTYIGGSSIIEAAERLYNAKKGQS